MPAEGKEVPLSSNTLGNDTLKRQFRIGMVTVILLVTLRVSIGCHFLYEGVWKIQHPDKFSTEPFLRMAKGPAAPVFHALVDDIDGRERLKIEPAARADGLTAAWRKIRENSERLYYDSIEEPYLAKLQPDEQLSEEDTEEIKDTVKAYRDKTNACLRASEKKTNDLLDKNKKEILAFCDAPEKQQQDAKSLDKLKGWVTELTKIENEYFAALKKSAEGDRNARRAVADSIVPCASALTDDVPLDKLVSKDGLVTTYGAKILFKKRVIVGQPYLNEWHALRVDTEQKYGLDDQHKKELEEQKKKLDDRQKKKLDEKQRKELDEQREEFDKQKTKFDEQRKAVETAYNDHARALTKYLDLHFEDIDAYFGSLKRFEDTKADGNNGADHQKQRVWDRQQELRTEVKEWLTDIEKIGQAYEERLWSSLTDEQREIGSLPVGWGMSDYLDFMLIFGLTAIGICLLLGLFTRAAALGGVGFLLVVLLNQPPWPTIFPHAPAVVGHALLVDKNFVEMIALLVLASTAVGRWGGLDHFVYRYIGEPLLNRKNKKDKPAGGSDESDS
ncbi:MAG: DoxX family protein [Candidatus Nealsonbacteria bacterium]|nr:DoxX family protein [Candidatus Nealsonbacteria bacterium]